MAEAIERVIDDVLRYRVATEELIAGLRRQTASSDDDVALMRSGISMEDKMRRSNSSEQSRNLTHQLAEFETVRRELRVSITAALVDEGLTTTEIGDLFGVTRQLANRFVQEARRADGVDAAPATGGDAGVRG